MKVFSKIKRSVRKSIMLGAITAAALGAGLFATSAVSAISGGNCDNNAVVPGGVASVSGVKAAYDGGASCTNGKVYKATSSTVQHVYNWFGIDKSALNNDDAVSGYVTKSGDVYAGGKLVATNATTAGYQTIGSGSHKQSYKGTVFYSRSPSVSFRDSQLSALVFEKNGVFDFAVINSCGNPVKATPKTPNYDITKEVRVKGDSKYQHDVTVDPGTTVEYKITVSSNGQVPAKNITVSDNLPSDTQYVNNSLKRDGNSVSNDSKFFTSGVTIGSLDNGDKTVYTFQAVIGKNDTPEKCSPETLDNEGTINAPQLPPKHGHAIVHKHCLPKPTFSCTNLNATVSNSDDFTYKFTAKSKVDNGAKVKGYDFDFGDGTTKHVDSNDTSTNVNHTYSKAGTYNTVVTALFNVGGDTKKDTGAACKATVKIKQPPKPTFACTSLTDVANTRTKFTFTAKATAANGAVITGYSFNFGDNQTAATNAATPTTSHTYAAAGTYTATVSALVSVNGAPAVPVTSAACSVKVTVTAQPMAECTGLTITYGQDRNITANVTYTATNGAKLSNIAYDFGDSTAVQNTTATSVQHTFAQDGTYTVKALLTFTGVENGANSSACQAPVTFTSTPPVYTCDEFDITKGANRTVTVSTFNTTQTNGATFSSADINWGDGNTDTNVNPVVGATHTYANDGTYAINAVAHFTVNGVDVTNSNHCQASVTYSTTPSCTPPQTGTPPNCVTPPTTLVNTGAGDMFGLFAAVAFVAGLGHRVFLSRRLTNEA